MEIRTIERHCSPRSLLSIRARSIDHFYYGISVLLSGHECPRSCDVLESARHKLRPIAFHEHFKMALKIKNYPHGGNLLLSLSNN